MRRLHLVIRYTWALPATIVGLVLSGVALWSGATLRLVDGVMEVAGGRVDRLASLLPSSGRIVAITFGHVILGVDHATLREVRSHERVHVRQYERWGVLFFPLYLGSSLVQLLLGRDPYFDNRFERAACLESTNVDSTVVPPHPGTVCSRNRNEA
jgi:hypothetical protein